MEENRLYTIGKISNMMGISVQTLRFYEKIGLFAPCYVNPETGYRYYEYSQLHKIDRIRYLQKLGISLKDIKDIYNSGNTAEILGNLRAQREKEYQIFKESQNKLEELDWYIEYFSFLRDKKHFGIVYMKRMEKRCAMVVDMGDGASFYDINPQFYELKRRAIYNEMECRRQYVSILDKKALQQGRCVTLQYGLYLKDVPEIRNNHIIEIPEGEYLCFLAPIYNEDRWSPAIFEQYLDKDKDYLVVANEYEDNLFRYDRCMYEIQIIEKP